MVTGKWQRYYLTGKRQETHATEIAKSLEAGGLPATGFYYPDNEKVYFCDMHTYEYVVVTNSSILVLLISFPIFHQNVE